MLEKIGIINYWKFVAYLIGVIIAFFPNFILAVSVKPGQLLPSCDTWLKFWKASGQTWGIHIVVMFGVMAALTYKGAFK